MSTTWQIPDERKFPKLEVDTEADVAIIGGGLAGVWCAYELAKRGKKVVVLDKDKLGNGETFYTTAFLTHVIDTDLVQLVDFFGEENAKLIWQSHALAIDRIEKVFQEEGFECNFTRTPLDQYAVDEKELKELQEECDLARKLGFDVEMIGPDKQPYECAGAMRTNGQAKYHPMKFLRGLIESADKYGAKFFENTEVEEYGGGEVKTKDGKVVKAKDIIVATYDPLDNPKKTKFKKGMYKTYVYELYAPKGSIPEGLYQDLANPYHYVRVDDVGDKMSVIVGGEDHRIELKLDEEKSFRALKEYYEKTFPNVEFEVVEHWSGQILEPSDGLALIGRFEANEYVACAFSGNGMTYSAITGLVIPDLIDGVENPYALLYMPTREMSAKVLASKAKDYVGEFMGGAGKNFFK